MTLAHAIKDYTEILANLFPPDETVSITKLLPSFIIFVGNSIKFGIIYIFSFEWFKTLIYLPIKIPELTSYILSEHLVFDPEPINAFSINFIPDQVTQLIPKLITGFLNGLVLALPFSTPQIIALRQTLFKGKYAGLASFSGLILGKLLFISCILFGIRWIIFPWIDLQAWNYLLGVGLIFFCLLKTLNEPADKLFGYQRIGNPFINTMLATKDQRELKQNRLVILRKMFFFQFILAWTEQNAIFSYLQGTHFDLSSSFLDIVVFENESIIGTHLIYLIGISFGLCLGTLFVCLAISRIWTFFLTQAELFFIPPEDFEYVILNLLYVTPKIQREHQEFWTSILTKLGDFFLKYRFPKKMSGPYLSLQFKRFCDASRTFFSDQQFDYLDVNSGDDVRRFSIVSKTVYISNYFFCIWLLIISLSTFSYYGIDNFVNYSLGFTPEDKALTYTRPKTYMTQFLSELHEPNDQNLSTFSGTLLDRSNYLFYPYRQDVPFIPIESWVGRDYNRPPSMEEREEGTERPLRESYSRRYNLNRKKNFFDELKVTTTWPQSTSHWFFKYDSVDEQKALKKATRFKSKDIPTFAFNQSEIDEFIEQDAFPRITNASFQWEFLNYDHLSTFETFVRSQYYTNPIFTNLLKGKMDTFIAQQPNRYNLTSTDEKQLFENRLALAHYYDTLRDYQIAVDHNLSLKPINSQQEPGSTIPITRSLANRVYNQQFSGTLGPMRRLFAVEYDFNPTVTLDPVKKRTWEQANQTPLNAELNQTASQTPNSSLVFQFDQPLYNENQNIPDLIRHESLDDDYLEDQGVESSPDPVIGPIQIPFLKPQISRPMFIGWDEELDKIIITDRYLAQPLSFEERGARLQGFLSGWLSNQNPLFKKASIEKNISSTNDSKLPPVVLSHGRESTDEVKDLLKKLDKLKSTNTNPAYKDLANYIRNFDMDVTVDDDQEKIQFLSKINSLRRFDPSLFGQIETKKAADGSILRYHFDKEWQVNPGDVAKTGYQMFEFTNWPIIKFDTRKVHRHYVLPWITFPNTTGKETELIEDAFTNSLEEIIPASEDVVGELGMDWDNNPISHPPNAAFSFAFSLHRIRDTAEQIQANPIAILPPTPGGFFWSGNALKFNISELNKARKVFTEALLEPNEDTIGDAEIKDLTEMTLYPNYYSSEEAEADAVEIEEGAKLPGLIPHREEKVLQTAKSSKNVKKGLSFSLKEIFQRKFMLAPDKEIGDEF